MHYADRLNDGTLYYRKRTKKRRREVRSRGKIAVVTGSSSGIGKETALLLAGRGYGLVLTYHKGQKEGDDVDVWEYL